jgi:hypothetical protein
MYMLKQFVRIARKPLIGILTGMNKNGSYNRADKLALVRYQSLFASEKRHDKKEHKETLLMERGGCML